MSHRFGNDFSRLRHNRHLRRLRQLAAVFGIGLAVAFGCIVLLAGFSWIRSQPAVNVAQEQIELIRNGKVEQAYALFSREYQAGTTLPMFRRWLRRQGRLSHVRYLRFWGRSVWGRTVLLRGNFQDDLGNRYPVRYVVIRENGSWRVRYLQLPVAETPDSQPSPERLLYI
ncbi:MAG: hypothetical protein HY648_01735 [Acidobacteria bacterium]|nr:hypothetical protein [Acidobacteriota bacterium]